MTYSKEEILLLETEIVDLLNGWIFCIEYELAARKFWAARRFFNFMLVSLGLLIYLVGKLSPFMWYATIGALTMPFTHFVWTFFAKHLRWLRIIAARDESRNGYHRAQGLKERPTNLSYLERNQLLALKHALMQHPAEGYREVHDQLGATLVLPKLKEWPFLYESLKKIKALCYLPSRHQA